jgi:hypothetical protein
VPASPRLLAGSVVGKVKRSYRVRTLDEVDVALVELNRWLAEQVVKAPEFGLSYVRKWRHDADLLLDVRCQLMERRDRVTPGPPPPATVRVG